MENNFFYKVAGHCFRLSFSNKDINEEALINYAPFRQAEKEHALLFHLTVVDKIDEDHNYHPVGQFDDDIASIHVYKSSLGQFRFHIAAPKNSDYCVMEADAAFQIARVHLPVNEHHRVFCLNNCLMLLYAFASANLDTLMMHASVIINNGDGFLFLGKSGTGKSTHTRLWMEHVDGSKLLNDDNPVIRIVEGVAKVYGTPWSGKTPCYRDEDARVKGIVRLHQAPENNIKKLPLLQAYAAVLAACSSMRWEEEIASGIHRTVEKLVDMVACYRLNCLPDKEAAELSAATIKQDQ